MRGFRALSLGVLRKCEEKEHTGREKAHKERINEIDLRLFVPF